MKTTLKNFVSPALAARVMMSSIDEIPDELHFDVVIASDVIEHVTNPILFVEQFTSKPSDIGVLILTTGDADNFLWNRFGVTRRIVDSMYTCFYGAFPRAFLSIIKSLQRMLGRSDSMSIPGVGISRDHLFVVFSGAAKS